MAYEAPTAAEFKARHTAFAAVSDATINALIVEANRSVDDTWLEGDYKNAIMYLVAHMLVQEGALNPDVIDKVGPITSERLGDASTTYGNAISSSSNTDYNSTTFGRSFLRLLRLNHGGPRTV